MTIELSDQEAAAVQRVVDAALKGSGVLILQEAGWLQTKLKQAVDASRVAPVAAKTVQPTIDETPI